MKPRELKTGAFQELDVAVLFPSPKFVCNRLAHFFANGCTSKSFGDALSRENLFW